MPVAIVDIVEAADQQDDRTGKPHERSQKELRPDTRVLKKIEDPSVQRKMVTFQSGSIL